MRLRTRFDLHDQAFCTVTQLDLRGEVALSRQQLTGVLAQPPFQCDARRLIQRVVTRAN